MTDHTEAPEASRRRWQRLSDQQRTIATDLMDRAMRMWEDADGEISLREAIELAALQVGRRPPDDLPTSAH